MAVSLHNLIGTTGKYVYVFKTATPPRVLNSWLQATEIGTTGKYQIDIEHTNLIDSLEGYDVGIWDTAPSEATLTDYSAPDGLRNMPLSQVSWLVAVSNHFGSSANPHSTDIPKAITATSGADAALTLANLNKLVNKSNCDALHIHGGANQASNITLVDDGGYWTATEVEALSQEIGEKILEVPAVPTGLDVTHIVRAGLYARLIISWTSVSGVLWDVNVSKAGVFIGDKLFTSLNHWQLTVHEDGTYDVQVRARSFLGKSEWCATVQEVVSGIGDAVDVGALKTKVNKVIDASDELIISKVNKAVVEGAAIYGNRIIGTTHATPNTETPYEHGLGRIPTIVSVIPTMHTANQIYESKAADISFIYLKCATASVAFAAYVN